MAIEQPDPIHPTLVGGDLIWSKNEFNAIDRLHYLRERRVIRLNKVIPILVLFVLGKQRGSASRRYSTVRSLIYPSICHNTSPVILPRKLKWRERYYFKRTSVADQEPITYIMKGTKVLTLGAGR